MKMWDPYSSGINNSNLDNSWIGLLPNAWLGHCTISSTDLIIIMKGKWYFSEIFFTLFCSDMCYAVKSLEVEVT